MQDSKKKRNKQTLKKHTPMKNLLTYHLIILLLIFYNTEVKSSNANLVCILSEIEINLYDNGKDLYFITEGILTNLPHLDLRYNKEVKFITECIIILFLKTKNNIINTRFWYYALYHWDDNT